MPNLDIQPNTIQSLEELRELVGMPHEAVAKKSVALIDDQAKGFIALSPMAFLSTSNRKGQCDVSPRGDKPGFVYVANPQQLVLPERPGNKRVDSLCNIIENPHAGLVFLIPGMEEVLRVNGRASVVSGHPVLEHVQMNGKTPALGIVIDVEECFIHCPRALKHAGVWEPEKWPAKEAMPSPMEIFHAHLRINGYKAD